jgi:predicted transcriptional regulator
MRVMMPEDLFNDKDKKVLELQTRREIYELVRKFVGSHFREIERKSNLPSGTVKYHLSYLVKHGLIKEEKDGNKVRYFSKEFKAENKKLLSLLRQKTIRDILLFILTHKDCNHEQIVKAINISPSTVSWHLKKLKDSNIIEFIKKGRKTFYNIIVDKDEIVKLLITYQESFLDSLVDRVIEMWE